MGRNDFDVGYIHFEGHWEGWALKIETFCALKWPRAKRVPFGPKKVNGDMKSALERPPVRKKSLDPSVQVRIRFP